METPFLDRLIENLQDHIEAIEDGNWLFKRLSVEMPELKKELAEYEAIKQALKQEETKCSGCDKPLQSGLCGECCSDLVSGMF